MTAHLLTYTIHSNFSQNLGFLKYAKTIESQSLYNDEQEDNYTNKFFEKGFLFIIDIMTIESENYYWNI